MDSSDDLHIFSSIMLLMCPFIVVFLSAQRREARLLPLPPGPFAWPVVGNVFSRDWRSPHLALTNLARSYGPLMSLRFGARLVIVASSPESAREILKTHDRDLAGRFVPHVVSTVSNGGTSVMTITRECNQNWRFLRGTAHTWLMSSKALESGSQIRLDKAKDMLDFLESNVGQEVNIRDMIFASSVNVIARAMVSEDLILDWKNIGEVKRSVTTLIDAFTPGFVDLYPAIGAFDFWSKERGKVGEQTVIAMWSDIVSKRRAKRRRQQQGVAISNQDMLDSLIESSCVDKQIYFMLMEPISSTFTISSTIEWAMAELIRNEGAFSKLRDELIMKMENEGTTALSEKCLARLPYLQAVIKETCRLHPPDPFLVPRCALQTCQIMNYEIPKNSLLLVNVFALGRDERNWEDPQTFKPERFVDTKLDLGGTHYQLLPFGGGRRMCAGYPLGLKLMQLFLASMVCGFDWIVPKGMLDPAAEKLDMNMQFAGVALEKEKPLHLIPKIRKF